MTPDNVFDYGIDVADRNFVFLRQHFSGHDAGLIERTNFKNLFLCKPCAGMLFSEIVSAFIDFIRDVISVCSKPKMGWFHAESIIAMVKNVHSFRNVSVGNDPRDSMSRARIPTTPEIPVSMSELNACPIPTFFRFLNFFPESCFKFFYVPLQNVFITVLHWGVISFDAVYKKYVMQSNKITWTPLLNGTPAFL